MPLHNRLVAIGRWAAGIIAAILLAVALHAVIPPFSLGMLALRIVATEGGLWIAIAGAIAGAITAVIALLIPSKKWLKSVTIIMAVGAGLVGLLPLSLIPR